MQKSKRKIIESEQIKGTVATNLPKDKYRRSSDKHEDLIPNQKQSMSLKQSLATDRIQTCYFCEQSQNKL